MTKMYMLVCHFVCLSVCPLKITGFFYEQGIPSSKCRQIKSLVIKWWPLFYSTNNNNQIKFSAKPIAVVPQIKHLVTDL